jgi:Flp pilus assembly protein TadD
LAALSNILLVLATGILFAQKPATEQAWDLVARDKRPEAIALLRSEVTSHPLNADARLLLGSLLSEAGKAVEAISHLREAVRLRPRSATARNALGEALTDTGDLRAARVEFERAVMLDPKLARARENSGLVLLEAGDLAGAAKQLDRAIQLYGEKEVGAYARYLRARVHTASGALKEAETQLQSAVGLRPDLAEAWSDLGHVREKLDNDKGALAALQRSVQLNPDGAIAQTRLGSLYLRLGLPADAVRHLERAVQLMPDDQTALNSLQRALREAGQPERAEQVKSRLVEVIRKRDRDSQNALAAVNLNNEGAELQKNGKLADAAQKYRAALELNPGHAGMRVNYAVALLRLGEWERGLEELRTAVRQDPSNQTFQKALEDALAQAPARFRESK